MVKMITKKVKRSSRKYCQQKQGVSTAMKNKRREKADNQTVKKAHMNKRMGG